MVVGEVPDYQVGATVVRGAAYVYSGSAYATVQKLTASDGAVYDTFGSPVGVSDDGTKVIVGASRRRLA